MEKNNSIFDFDNKPAFAYDPDSNMYFRYGLLNPSEDDMIIVQYSDDVKDRVLQTYKKFENIIKDKFPNNGIIFISDKINVGSFERDVVIKRLRTLVDELEKENSENI
jgi:hypothetical protein